MRPIVSTWGAATGVHRILAALWSGGGTATRRRLSLQASTRLNLAKATTLIVDDNQQSLDILASVMTSFGVRSLVRAENGREAQETLQNRPVDLVLTDAQMPEMDGYDLVHWMRRTGPDASRITPVILVTAHTRKGDVARARDCGANFIIAKPLTPKIVLERILWVARGDRMFVECDSYVGPDRRFKHLGPPAEHPEGRRRDDVSTELGAAQTPNLSQADLDQLVKPQKAAL